MARADLTAPDKDCASRLSEPNISVSVTPVRHRVPSLRELIEPWQHATEWHLFFICCHGEMTGFELQRGDRVARIAWFTNDFRRQNHDAKLAALQRAAEDCLDPVVTLAPPVPEESPRVTACRRALVDAGVTGIELRADYDDDERGRRYVADTLVVLHGEPRIAVTLFRGPRWRGGFDWIRVTTSSGRVASAARRSPTGSAEIQVDGDGETQLLLERAINACLDQRRK